MTDYRTVEPQQESFPKGNAHNQSQGNSQLQLSFNFPGGISLLTSNIVHVIEHSGQSNQTQASKQLQQRKLHQDDCQTANGCGKDYPSAGRHWEAGRGLVQGLRMPNNAGAQPIGGFSSSMRASNGQGDPQKEANYEWAIHVTRSLCQQVGANKLIKRTQIFIGNKVINIEDTLWAENQNQIDAGKKVQTVKPKKVKQPMRKKPKSSSESEWNEAEEQDKCVVKRKKIINKNHPHGPSFVQKKTNANQPTANSHGDKVHYNNRMGEDEMDRSIVAAGEQRPKLGLYGQSFPLIPIPIKSRSNSLSSNQVEEINQVNLGKSQISEPRETNQIYEPHETSQE